MSRAATTTAAQAELVFDLAQHLRERVLPALGVHAGTRAAMAGLESACVAVALAPVGDGQPTMGDLELGCVIEIKSGDWFLARRDAGLRSSRKIHPGTLSDVSRMFWSYGFRGRPAVPQLR